MVGLSDLFWAYQNSGPALLFILVSGATLVWKMDIQPRLKDLEQTQEERGDRWADQRLNSRERAMLLEDAHERADDIEVVMSQLKERVRGIEQAYAIEHGKAPGEGFTRSAPGDTDDGEPQE